MGTPTLLLNKTAHRVVLRDLRFIVRVLTRDGTGQAVQRQCSRYGPQTHLRSNARGARCPRSNLHKRKTPLLIPQLWRQHQLLPPSQNPLRGARPSALVLEGRCARV